jgi:PAS domain S-box-containing protein
LSSTLFSGNILRNVKESVIVTDLYGKVIYYNHGAEALYGYTAQEMIGHELVAIYPEQPNPAERERAWEMLRSGKSYIGEWLGKKKNNELVWVDVTSTLFVNEKGEPIGLIGVSKDITDRKKTEEQLRKSEVYLQSIFDATIQAYYLLDSNYSIIKFNKTGAEAIKKVFGRDLQVGDNMLTYSEPSGLEEFKINVQRAFAGETVMTSHEVTSTPGKRFWFEVQYLPARNERNEIYGVAFVSLDITQRMLTEKALLKSYQEVQNFRSALNTSALISLTDTKGTILEVNESFCKVSKFCREELLGHTHRVVNSGYHPKEFFAEMWQTISAGQSWKAEVKNKAKDGSYYWVDTSITPILDEMAK